MKPKFIVISLLSSVEDRYFGCQIVPEGSIYPMIYRKVYGPADYFDCFEWIGFNCRRIEPEWEADKARAEALEARAKAAQTERSAEALILPSISRKVELGHINGVPEVKVEWEGGWIKYPVFYHRESKIVAYAEFSAPENLLNRVWGDIVSCAVAAGVVAGIALIIASPAAALAAFKAAFFTCIKAKIGNEAEQISVGLSTHQEHTEWHRV